MVAPVIDIDSSRSIKYVLQIVEGILTEFIFGAPGVGVGGRSRDRGIV